MLSAPCFSLVNAFSDKAFGGNPAAVVWSEARLAPIACASLAREFGLPATSFVATRNLALRWFNASGELTLCGHGTLAAAHVLREAGMLTEGHTLTFSASGGPLSVRAEGDLLWLNLVAAMPRQWDDDRAIAAALGVKPAAVARGALDLIVEVGSAVELAELRPNFDRVRQLDTRGVIVTASAADGSADYVMRFFAPRLGIDEDAVTATAHAALAPLWAARLSRAELVGRQLSVRGGTVRSRLAGDRCEIAGEAITLVEGTLRSGWA